MEKNTTAPALLQTKQHFDILDGLRGVAALAVVIFHFMEWVYTDPAQNFIGHGFLAVDFFFCLSGFVIGYAYDDRLGRMGVKEFFKSRIIRLHPLVVAGSVMGLLAFLFDPFGMVPESYSAGKIVLIFLCSMLLVPFPVMGERGNNLFGLNAPSWSLFWEYMANIAYALLLHRLRRIYLVVLTVVAAMGIVYVANRSGNLLGGWSGPTFWDGGVRIAYSFLAGLLIYRSRWTIPNRLGFPGLAVLLSFAFVMPFTSWNWLSETLIVLLYFPLLVALGAGATLRPGMKAICTFSGKISYPLYMTHYAFLWMFGNWYTSRKPGGGELAWVIILGVMALVGVAYLVMKGYDAPLRKYLTARRNARGTGN